MPRQTLARKNVMLEERKVRELVSVLKAKSESEAIRRAIGDRLLAEEVMDRVLRLRRRGTLQDPYRRAGRRRD